MTDEIMDNLKQVYMKDKENIPDECPMADQVSGYAFGELSPDESGKVKEHLKSCRFCLDLFMDIRMADEEATKLKDQKVEVLPGLQKAIDKSKKSSDPPFKKIVEVISDFFSGGIGYKQIAAVATLVLVLFVGIYVTRDVGPISYSIQIRLQGKIKTEFRSGQPEYKEVMIEPGGELNSSDYFRIQTKIDKKAYVYIVFQDSSGNIQTFEKGYVRGGEDFFLPEANEWYQLDDNTGTEKIYLIALKKKVDDLNNRIETLKAGGIDAIKKIFPEATIQSFSFEHK
jgi:hypothetical protein